MSNHEKFIVRFDLIRALRQHNFYESAVANGKRFNLSPTSVYDAYLCLFAIS